MAIDPRQVCLTEIPKPVHDVPDRLPVIPPDVYRERLRRTRETMDEQGLDVLVIYADREHFANFEYLVGFDPRFEEALLVIHPDGLPVVILGNECFTPAEYSPIEVTPLLYQEFSLPSQPRDRHRPLTDLLRESGIKQGSRVGIVGWKLFERESHDSRDLFDVPHFIIEAVIQATGSPDRLHNATGLFIEPGKGLRTICEVNQVAVMEYGAVLASNGVHTLIDHLRPGVTEVELGAYLDSKGLPVSCHPMVSTGEKARWALTSPSSRAVARGDQFTTAFGVRGGLTCRAGYVAESIDDLKTSVRDWIDQIVKPYFAAVATWYETIGIGVTGGEVYEAVQNVFPRERYGWFLNPGHQIAHDEWLSSPIFPGSQIPLQSGQALQMDIIPFPSAPYFGVNAEDGIILADEELRKKIETLHPDMWRRMQARRAFMIEVLGINLKPEVLPMSNYAGLLRPLLLNKELGMKVRV